MGENNIMRFAVVCIMLVALSGCAADTRPADLTPVTIRLSWHHTAEFAGLYVAHERGYYLQEGLNVTIEPIDFAYSTIDYVNDKHAEFGVASTDELLIAHDNNRSLEGIFAVFQRNPQVLISLKSSNITLPEDLNGRTIILSCGITGEYNEIAFLNKYNIKYTRSCLQNTLNQLLDGKADAQSGFVTNEVQLYAQQGYMVNYLLLADFGVITYPNLIFARDDFIKANPELVMRFVRATSRGMEYSLQHREYALNATMSFGPELNRAHQLKTLEIQHPFIFDGTGKIGLIHPEPIEYTLRILEEQRLLKHKVNATEVYTSRFVESLGNQSEDTT